MTADRRPTVQHSQSIPQATAGMDDPALSLAPILAVMPKIFDAEARLRICTLLTTGYAVDYTYLQQHTGLTTGNLSGHLNRLEHAGLVLIQKEFINKRPHTRVRLTPAGERTLTCYWSCVDELRSRAETLKQRWAMDMQPHP